MQGPVGSSRQGPLAVCANSGSSQPLWQGGQDPSSRGSSSGHRQRLSMPWQEHERPQGAPLVEQRSDVPGGHGCQQPSVRQH
mmetsp:Transcript_47246/g.109315  ORF Transcript_47246/g.109315 Transcript_47246/m.109315 type:complete len:82 (-) Transcript_47246:1084-1329(-)